MVRQVDRRDRHGLKVAPRNIPVFHDFAVIWFDQLKQIHVDGELDLIETTN